MTWNELTWNTIESLSPGMAGHLCGNVLPYANFRYHKNTDEIFDMLSDLLATIRSENYHDAGSIIIHEAAWRENMLDLFIELDFQDDTPAQDWQITCVHPRSQQLSMDFASYLTVSEDHILLWQHKVPYTQLYFSGSSVDPLSVVGALYQRHTDLTLGWIPFERFLNPLVKLTALLMGPSGMLADGPESLLLVYAEVLREHGYNASHLPSRRPRYWDGEQWKDEESSLKVLLLDRSYVVAEDFQATQRAQ